jgi:hypothetical protein
MNISEFEYIYNFFYIVSACCNVSLTNHTRRISCEMNRVTLVIGLAITLAIGIAIGLVQQQDARGIGIIVHGADANGANGINGNAVANSGVILN